MNRIYHAIIKSKEFVDEARKVPVGIDCELHRQRMLMNLHAHVAELGITLDPDDLALRNSFLQGDLDQEDIAVRMSSQLVGRAARPR